MIKIVHDFRVVTFIFNYKSIQFETITEHDQIWMSKHL